MKPDSTKYEGFRQFDQLERRHTATGVVVTVDGRPLYPQRSQKLHNHSPDGFNWGYGGSGPAQLALAILLDFTDDPELSLRHYQVFKSLFVEKMSHNWEVSGDVIRQWIEELEEHD